MQAEPSPKTLYRHEKHPHTPKNPNEIHIEEINKSTINQKIAIILTRIVASMWCAYLFAFIAVIGFPGFLGPLAAQLVQWTSQTFIQLTMLSVIMVGQSVLGRKQELQSDELFETSKHSFSDIEQIMKHLDEQDKAILTILQELQKDAEKMD